MGSAYYSHCGPCSQHKSYGFFSFCGDVFMTVVTAGFWLIWVFVREMRNR